MQLVTIPDIAALIDGHLRAKREARVHVRKTDATWLASTLGSCLRRQWLQYHVKRPVITEPDALALRRFEVGEIMEEWAAAMFDEMGLLRARQIDYYAADLDLSAHADFMLGPEASDGWRCGVEWKSVQSKYFWYRTKEKDTTASPENMMQAACYKILANREGQEMPWLVVPISKDDLFTVQDVVTDAHCREALRRLSVLNAAKVSGDPPPCTCMDPKGEWGGGGWKWCPFYEGHPTRQKGAKPDGECCVIEDAA